MTIEQKALKTWGEACGPSQAIWILKNGILINGCMGGYIRDVDHSEIGQFFKRSKYHEPGSNWLYVKKFIRRGNIRMSMEGGTAYFELFGLPTRVQWRAMGQCFAAARREGKNIEIERLPRTGHRRLLYSREEYLGYLERYAPHILAPA